MGKLTHCNRSVNRYERGKDTNGGEGEGGANEINVARTVNKRNTRKQHGNVCTAQVLKARPLVASRLSSLLARLFKFPVILKLHQKFIHFQILKLVYM